MNTSEARRGAGPRWQAVAWLLLAGGLGLRVAHIAWRFDLDWEPDSYQHVLMAREAISNGISGLWTLLDVWAKPVFTAMGALLATVLPASWPLLPAVQIANVMLWALSCWIVARLARDALQSDFAQPLTLSLGLFGYVTFKDSVSALTEPAGALLVALALDASHRGHRWRGLLLSGFAPLARLDAVLLTALQWVAEAWTLTRERQRGWLWKVLLAGLVAASPLLLWNLAGAIHTGNPLYVKGSYATSSPYGHGSFFHFVREYARFEPAVVVGLGLALVACAVRRTQLPRVVLLATAQSLVYLLVLSLFWARGKFLAELLRYFVVAYPCWLLAAAAGFTALLSLRELPAWVRPALLTVILIGQALELRRLLAPSEMIDSQLSSLASLDRGSAPYRALAALRPKLSQRPIFSDRPEASYYLGLRNGIYSAPGPREVTRPDLHGYFVFSGGGWSESLGAKRSDFADLPLVAHLPPDIDLYEKP